MIFERFREGSLDRKEQRAFAELADALIFEAPQNFKLSRETVPELSHRIQDAFLAQDERHEKGKQQMVDDIFQSIKPIVQRDVAERKERGEAEPVKEVKPEESAKEKAEKPQKTPAEQFLSEIYIYIGMRRFEESNAYGAWGFTPKLSGLRTKEKNFYFGMDGKNCLGVTQALGGMFRRMGLHFEMGITADHPFALVQFEDKTYLASLYGIAEIKGKFEYKNGYKMYIPAEGDNIPESLMLVWNFDEALVYQVLENVELLRQISLGNVVVRLPGTQERAKEIATRYKDVLQGADWRKIQSKVAPELSQYFEDENKSWELEVDRISIERHVKHVVKNILEAGHEATSMKDLTFDEFIDKFLPVAKEHGKTIAEIVMSDAIAPEGTPADVVIFAKTAREGLSLIEVPEVKDEIARLFLRPFFVEGEPLTRGE